MGETADAMPTTQKHKDLNIEGLIERIEVKKATVGVIGLGYVGLPLAMAFGEAAFPVLGFDVDPKKTEALQRGESYIRHIPGDRLRPLLDEKRFDATTDFDRLGEPDAILICVPTPLTQHREPDLSYIEKTGEAIAQRLRPGQLVVLESTTWPGTTEEVLLPILERSGLQCGRDFLLAFSPEREDPGNPEFSTTRIPKVIGGVDKAALAAAEALYGAIVVKTVGVSSARAAEAVKLTENIFRSVNIALVNELKTIYRRMGIDVWEVIDAAATKPFGFMPFWPGPGLGGHCIPIDPFYLTWKAREYECPTRFIELAGEINTAMPAWVVDRVADALNERERSVKGARILLLGVAYKKDVADPRESPSFKLMELLEERGARIDFYDPFIPEIPSMREWPQFAGRRSIEWNADALAAYDAVLIATAHSCVDYAELVRAAPLIVDTRNVTNGLPDADRNVVKA